MQTSGGIRAYARHRKCAIRAVEKAMSTGRIPFSRDGKTVTIDFALADKAWAANTDAHQSARAAKQRGGKAHPDTIKAPPDFPDPIDDPEGAAAAGGYEIDGPARPLRTLAQAQFAVAVEKALAARRERLKDEGTLVKAVEVRAAAFETARRARDRLLNLPDQLAPMLVGVDDLAEVRERIEREVRKVCVELGGEAS